MQLPLGQRGDAKPHSGEPADLTVAPGSQVNPPLGAWELGRSFFSSSGPLAGYPSLLFWRRRGSAGDTGAESQEGTEAPLGLVGFPTRRQVPHKEAGPSQCRLALCLLLRNGPLVAPRSQTDA